MCRVWWIAKYKSTILIHQYWISSKIYTNSSRGSSHASRVFTADAAQAVWLKIQSKYHQLNNYATSLL